VTGRDERAMTMEAVQVHPSNAEQLAAWDGDEGAYWAQHAEYFDRSIAAHDRPFFEAARIQATDHVLDVGCGTGQDTRRAARVAHDGSAVGVDLSAAMLDYARRAARADGFTNVSFLQADVQVHPFSRAGFDVAISRTSAMFFGDHAAAFANIRGALRPGGRLVLLTWQGPDHNEWLREIATALAAGRPPMIPPSGVGPFALADPARIEHLLTGAGFGDIDVAGNAAPMWFGDNGQDASRFLIGLMGWMLQGLDDDGTKRAHDALLHATTAHETANGVTFESATWITTARSL